MGGARQLEHTADLALEVWAETREALFAEAAKALTAVLTGGSDVESKDTRTVAVEGLDPEDLLVRWLNELIYLAVTQGFLVRDARVRLEDPRRLVAELFGEEHARAKIETELKSATYHDLALEERDGTVRARFVIDV